MLGLRGEGRRNVLPGHRGVVRQTREEPLQTLEKGVMANWTDPYATLYQGDDMKGELNVG